MASSGSNSSLAPVISHRRNYYDVYVTFSGADTRNNFTAFLIDALETKGIFVFRDDINLQKGESIGTELIRAIERSQIYVAVFSRNYASSARCLQELQKICECVQGTQKHILPIFYDVDPSEVRKQTGIYGEAFAKHEQRFQQNSQMVSRWREALKQVGNISGWDLRDRDQLKAINNIEEQISRRVLLHNSVSQTAHKATKVKMPISHWEFEAETAWRVVGLMSSVVGLICYALSPSFHRLIGKWTTFKFFLCGALCAAIFTTILFAKHSSLFTGHGQLKTYTNFAVLMIISVYSFFYDKTVDGKPEILSIVSNAAFALVSLSLHKLINLGFEIGVFSYFLGCFTVQLLTINWMFIFVALFIGCPLFVMHSSLNFQQKTASGGHVIHPSSDSNANVDSRGESIDQSSHSNPNVNSGGQNVDLSSHSNPNVDSGGQAVVTSSHSNPNVDSGGQVVDPSSHSNPNVDSGGQHVIDIHSES